MNLPKSFIKYLLVFDKDNSHIQEWETAPHTIQQPYTLWKIYMTLNANKQKFRFKHKVPLREDQIAGLWAKIQTHTFVKEQIRKTFGIIHWALLRKISSKIKNYDDGIMIKNMHNSL